MISPTAPPPNLRISPSLQTHKQTEMPEGLSLCLGIVWAPPPLGHILITLSHHYSHHYAWGLLIRAICYGFLGTVVVTNGFQASKFLLSSPVSLFLSLCLSLSLSLSLGLSPLHSGGLAPGTGPLPTAVWKTQARPLHSGPCYPPPSLLGAIC